MMRSDIRARTCRFARFLILGAFAVLSSGGCNSLTGVDSPDVRVPEDFATASGASALAVGAITQFLFAFGGVGASANFAAGTNQVTLSGLFADELTVTTHASGAAAEWDRRVLADLSLFGGALYTPLQQTRINLLTAISTFQNAARDSTARIAQLFALTGYTEVFLGENFCAGIPLGRLDAKFSPVYGQPLTAEQMFQQAIADFDSALTYAANTASISHLARLGKGRALLNLGRFNEAAEAVASVPSTYVHNAEFVTGILHNGVYAQGSNNVYTVPEREGGNGLDWRSANDSRVPLLNRSPALIGLDGATEVWTFTGYSASNTPIPLARGIEGRLTEAEAALQSGNAAAWLAIHNALRATIPALASLDDPGTTAGRVDLHFRERAFWLFLTGHRHGDLRRLVRQYGRDPETLFPVGPWRAGQSYDGATNAAPPAQEGQNPNFAGCLSRNA